MIRSDRARPLLAALLAAPLGLTAALATTGCETWRCGYGGPGCSAPGLRGLCEAAVAVNEAVEVTVLYYDDTGGHPATLRSATSDDPALEVALGEEEGALLLSGRSVGVATLSLEIDGWDAPQTWTFAIQPPSDAPHDPDCDQAELLADDAP
jgi:hypothetical protein